MNANTRGLHDLGQRLWLDNINRELLTSGTLARYIAELSVTGLTSNPTIFEHAIGTGTSYDDAIQKLDACGLSVEELFFELALQDLTQAADLFRPIFDASGGVDGWGFARSLAAACKRHRQHHQGRDATANSSCASEPLHQDSRHA